MSGDEFQVPGIVAAYFHSTPSGNNENPSVLMRESARRQDGSGKFRFFQIFYFIYCYRCGIDVNLVEAALDQMSTTTLANHADLMCFKL